MGLADTFYNVFVKRNSVYVATIIVGAFAGERMVHSIGDSLWESNNKGKLYKHMLEEKQ
ncbi:cytochrome b-c1 complex subunit 9 [Chlorella sorokiniana]|jgi:ubiquinol-cytochrome c reductase subunit 9|uniref:Complex III subunit 9 n=1 Tax=Chlorella sorokiniana TaxID=3076 RepID=A0A2P6TT20_CHLSO|nr:cytochrome b-c1 complex subunit 9 [Chlorella sorokiniana]|eukprot:PRW57194.1 cytochrome b-c1 complex subunit 9 [Chlorella sorokiniana]